MWINCPDTVDSIIKIQSASIYKIKGRMIFVGSANPADLASIIPQFCRGIQLLRDWIPFSHQAYLPQYREPNRFFFYSYQIPTVFHRQVIICPRRQVVITHLEVVITIQYRIQLIQLKVQMYHIMHIHNNQTRTKVIRVKSLIVRRTKHHLLIMQTLIPQTSR